VQLGQLLDQEQGGMYEAHNLDMSNEVQGWYLLLGGGMTPGKKPNLAVPWYCWLFVISKVRN
jgi:hypothetical protein